MDYSVAEFFVHGLVLAQNSVEPADPICQQPDQLDSQQTTIPSSQVIPRYMAGVPDGEFGVNTVDFAIDYNSIGRGRRVELIHGRWALLGAIGLCTPELLRQHVGVSSQMVLFQAGTQYLSACGGCGVVPCQGYGLLPMMVTLGLQAVLASAVEKFCGESVQQEDSSSDFTEEEERKNEEEGKW